MLTYTFWLTFGPPLIAAAALTWAVARAARRQATRPSPRVLGTIVAVSILVALPGIAWIALGGGEESPVAVGLTASTLGALGILVWAQVRKQRRRTAMREAVLAGGDDADEAIVWMRGEADRVRLERPTRYTPEHAEVIAEDAIVAVASGRHEDAEELVRRASAPVVLAQLEFERMIGALAALRLIARGDLDGARAALPGEKEIPAVAPARAYDLVGATSALHAVLAGEIERAARLAASRTGERPFAAALRTLARAHAAAATGERDTALREIAALRATRFAAILDRYPGPATQLARAEGPYRA